MGWIFPFSHPPLILIFMDKIVENKGDVRLSYTSYDGTRYIEYYPKGLTDDDKRKYSSICNPRCYIMRDGMFTGLVSGNMDYMYRPPAGCTLEYIPLLTRSDLILML